MIAAVLIFFELFCLLSIYVIKGDLAPWVWSGWIFILAPVSCIAFLVEIILIVYRMLKRKDIRWNARYLLLTGIGAFPITILFGISPITYPDNVKESAGVVMQVPVDHAVLFGGKDYKTHAIWPSERYAYDILVEPYDVNSKDLSDYGIYLAEVTSPVTGTIIDLKEDEEDILPNTDQFTSSLGNYIVMKIDSTGTYVVLAHLEKDSIEVEVGDHVEVGTYLAKVGNSGTTSEPHLHIQHQKNNPKDIAFPTCAKGLPIIFE